MSANASTASKTDRVVRYLDRALSRTDGALYVKSKDIAEDIDLSTREIGSCLGRLAAADGPLVIEKWSYTNATTWRVSTR